MKKRMLTGWIAISTLLTMVTFAQTNHYAVTETVRLEKPNNFGLNFGLGLFKPWNTAMYNNIWNNRYSFEPITFRHNGQATGGSTTYIEAIKGEPVAFVGESKRAVRSPGMGYWYLMSDGLWDGAHVAVYRETEDSVELIRSETVRSFKSPKKTGKENPTEGEQRIYFEKEGPEIQQGDLYVLTMSRLHVPDVVSGSDYTSVLQRNGFFRPTSAGVSWVLDDQTFAPEGESTASLKLTLDGKLSSKYAVSGLYQGYLRLGGKELGFREGKKYRCEVWLKKDADLKGPAVIQIGDRITKKCVVTTEWEKFSFEVPSDTPIGEKIYYLIIGAKEAGTLWVDNFVIYEEEVEPFAIYPHWADAMKKYKPGIIRDMSGRGLLTLDGWLSEGFSRKPIWSPKSGIASGGGQGNIGLKQFLELCEEVGSNPYLMTYILYSNEEIDHLMEYLGAPADVGYGKLRAKHGHPKPWTETFDTLYVECANEMWNGNFAPQAFPEQAELAGKVSNRLFRRMKNSPWNTQKNISGVASAFVNSLYRWKDRNTGEYVMHDRAKGWTFRCAENTPELDALATGASGYIGGWDGSTAVGLDDSDLFQSNLFYPARHFEPKLEDINALRGELFEILGKDRIELVKYEAGPGYSIPNAKKPWREEEERIGKSLALGIATLDNFLFVINNDGNSNYFKFTGGNNWSSHNKFMVPHTTYLALTLRNEYCKGALLEVEEGVQNRVTLKEQQSVGLDNRGNRRKTVMKELKDVPLTRLYAFKDGSTHSYIFLNRSFTEEQTIELSVPYTPSSEYTLYSLTHKDPRITNREKLNVDIVEEQKTGFTKKFTFVMAPSSAYVIRNESK